jgi:hypothetical protein
MKRVLIAGVLLASLAATALAQDHSTMDHAAMARESSLSQPGQSAFAAIQEVTERLSADPNTDWSRINIDALREHLIDMDEVTLRADIHAEPINGGARYIVTGEGRTRDAIQRMVLGHASAMGDAEHWTMRDERTAEGAVVTVMAKQASGVARIRALGLIGMMSEGAHHQPHHWMLATGERPH